MNNGKETQTGKLEVAHRQRIIDYYKEAQRYYELAWHGKTYGLHYGLWTEGIRNRHEAITNENKVLADLAQISQGERVLDAGCGIGGSGIWLAENRGAFVVGLNIVQKQLDKGMKLAKEKGVTNKVTFQWGDYQDMPFSDESFDVVWSLESIEHASDVDRFLQESYRVLKPGGRMVVAATFLGRHNLSPEERRQMELGQAVSGCFNDFRTADEVAESMRQTGFPVVTNINMTDQVMRSSQQMTRMCRWGLPPAKALAAFRLIPRVLVLNNQWGTYQEGLFRSGATSYNLLLAIKPQSYML